MPRPSAPHRPPVPTLAAIALAFLLAACAGGEAAKKSPPPAVTSASDPLAGSEAVFLAAYTGIAERHIAPTAVRPLAEEGLKGLTVIDPATTVERRQGGLVIRHAGTLVLDTPTPDDNDAPAWARLTVDSLRAVRAASVEVRETGVERIYEAVFDAALSELDVFSRYAGADEALRNRSRRDGHGGIGIRFRMEEDAARITHVMAETPAAEAGLGIGDAILAINGTPLAGLPSREVSKRLQGPIYSRVALEIRPKKGPAYRKELARAHIVPETVTARVENGVLHLRVNGFNVRTADAVAEALDDINRKEAAPVDGIVLDLRGNPGGLLRQSIKVADLFLGRGQIMSTRGRHPESLHRFPAGGTDTARARPLVVLVDGTSASAAEVVAAALQDLGRAVVVGATSYGKGTVQTVIPLPNGGEITLTWSGLIAPSGYAIHGRGVRPAICTGTRDAAPDPVGAALKHADAVAAGLRAWRTIAAGTPSPSPAETARLKRLADACPRTPRRIAGTGKTDPDLAAARALLGDRLLYARALALAAMPEESAEMPGKAP